MISFFSDEKTEIPTDSGQIGPFFVRTRMDGSPQCEIQSGVASFSLLSWDSS